ncbi:Tetratricopeptide repeat-containing protein [Marivirga sericea]|uniref:Tetratricopeptide repeat-containing protein n=1 Tax=Marivirga sericea TaxID=1028 RepID=A0A1X7JN86_9BACT|nr:tetratricopeptide repeat protein [Marivirga sericea]SMG29696.1 Tetratricopeptide repeat-containing protein [Marivirga sericea]
MKKFRIVLGVVLMILVNAQFSEAQKVDSLMYKAYLLSSDNLWEAALNQFDKERPLQKAIAYYGILNNTMVASNEEKFDEFVDPALEYIESLEEQGIHKAEAMALRSSIYGFIMAYSPWKGMYYGPKSSSAIESAVAMNSDSPIVNMISGTSLFYTPETFGGDKEAAVKAFEKAIALYEKANYKGWLYINTLASLGQAYQAIGQKDKAIETYEKALTVEPEFKWVSSQLLPQAQASK